MKALPAFSAALLSLFLLSHSHAQTETTKEFLPPAPAGKVTMNLHWDGYGKEHKSAGTNTTITALTEGFHDYGLLWTPEEYVFYVDGKEIWRTGAGGVSQVPEYLKLTEEIGKWGGDIAKAQLPDYFEVDDVRVYEITK